MASDLSAKWLEFLIIAVPDAKQVGVLWDPGFPASAPQLKELEAAAPSLKVKLVPVGIRVPEALKPSLQAISEQGARAVILLPGPLFAGHLQEIAELTVKARLPSMFGRKEHVEAGGLMSYGTNFAEMYRRAGVYVDKILRGAKPADLPVEQPTKFELAINLKTAKALGITVPLDMLQLADEVIE
jgi:putative tryptophan/tyrosine transport system substrate-binding protein